MKEKIKKILKPRIKLVPGTRLTSLLFIGASVLIAAGILIAANIYYNIDTGEIVMEEIQRVTQVIRATAGLIVGGSATQNPESGYVFQVVGQSKLQNTILEGYLNAINSSEAPIRFSISSSGFYVGFKAPVNLEQNTIYTWPTNYPSGPGYLLTSDTSGNLSWTSPASAGLGDITAVGDVSSGEAFVSSAGNYGNILWFHPNANYTMALTAASGLTANATTIIPAVSGQNYLVLTPSALTSGQVLLATGNYTLGGNSALTFSGGILNVGTSGTAGQIRIYNSSGKFLGFAATSTMTGDTLYYWPSSYGSANQVLTTDGAGNLIWSSVQGVGGITGSGAAGQVAFFNGTQSITGSSNFTWDNVSNVLTISGTIVANTFTGPSGATTIITSASGQNILLDPATGKIYLGSGDYIVTAGGYEIGKAGTQVLREMVPIMGFDLPVKTATSGTVTISRTIQSYPFSACSAGTTRIHKLVIRYGSMGTTTWQVATSGGAVASFNLPPTNSTSSGTVFTAQVAIPTPTGSCSNWSQTSDTDDWWINISPGGNATMIYQIFLAAYDEIL